MKPTFNISIISTGRNILIKLLSHVNFRLFTFRLNVLCCGLHAKNVRTHSLSSQNWLVFNHKNIDITHHKIHTRPHCATVNRFDVWNNINNQLATIANRIRNWRNKRRSRRRRRSWWRLMRLSVDKIERNNKKKNEIVNNVTECEYYVSMVRHKSPCIKIWINFFVCFNILFYIFRLPFHWMRVCVCVCIWTKRIHHNTQIAINIRILYPFTCPVCRYGYRYLWCACMRIRHVSSVGIYLCMWLSLLLALFHFIPTRWHIRFIDSNMLRTMCFVVVGLLELGLLVIGILRCDDSATTDSSGFISSLSTASSSLCHHCETIGSYLLYLMS